MKQFAPVIAIDRWGKPKVFDARPLRLWQAGMDMRETANKNWLPGGKLLYEDIAKALPMAEERRANDRSSVDFKPVIIGLKAIEAQSFPRKELVIAEYLQLLETFAKNMERRNTQANIARNTDHKISEEQRFWQEFEREFKDGKWRENRWAMLSENFSMDLKPLFVYDLCAMLGAQAEMVLFADRVAVRTNNRIIDKDPEKQNCYKIRLMGSEESAGLRSEGGLPHAMSHIFWLMGGNRMKCNDWTGALALFFRAIELDPKYAAAQNMAGMALYNLGGMEDAASHFRETIRLAKIDSDKAFGFCNLASACKFIDTPSSITEGIAACDSAIALNRRHANAYIVKAELQHMAGKSEAALKTCRQANELFPHFAEVYRVMGNVYQDIALYELARHSFDRYKELGGKGEE